MISFFPAAMVQVVGPSLAPRLKKHCTTGTLRHAIARSKGRIPLTSTCSSIPPRSSNNCNKIEKKCV